MSAHPDKGGATADFQELEHAYHAWTAHQQRGTREAGPAESVPPTPGRDASTPAVALPASSRGPEADEALLVPYCGSEPRAPVFRIRSVAVLLTYSLGKVGHTVWSRLVSHIQGNRRGWKVKNWSATLEESKGGAVHAHLMVQFHCAVDVPSSTFAFEGVRPNARPSCTDYLGERFSKRNPQLSLDRGFFYVWADKIGTVRLPDGSICVAGDYAPAWTDAKKNYRVKRSWPQALWEARKLSHDVWDELLFLTRQNVISGKRNLDSVREHELQIAEEAELRAVVKRIRGNPELYRPFIKVPEAERWLQCFQQDALRFPILLVLASSRVGKTEWAKSLFERPLVLQVGVLTHFPAKMSEFCRCKHDAVVLDDIRDLDFLAQHQHILQGKYDERVEFASTPGGQLAYQRWLYRVPFVATVNYSTENLEFLRTHDWLQKPDNCVVVELLAAPVEPASGSVVPPAPPEAVPVEEALRSWSVADVKTFLYSRDLRGLADICFTNGMNGTDFAELEEGSLEAELRLTPFQAKKLLSARAAFLDGRVGDGRSRRAL